MSRGRRVKYEPGFADRLMAARANAGLTQSDIRRRLYIGRGTVSDWEMGRTTPGVMLLEKLAEALGVSARWLSVGEADHSERPDTADLPVVDMTDVIQQDEPGPVCNPAFGWAGWRA